MMRIYMVWLVAHTRWATHGAPSEHNAHPHFSGTPESPARIVIAHNGIIENYEAMRKRLHVEGFEFISDTDSEVIAHLIAFNLKHNADLVTAVCVSIVELQGAYAIAVMEEARPERIVLVRNGAPLLSGLGENGDYSASDASAFLKATRSMIYLEEGDGVELTSSYRIVNCLSTSLVNEIRRPVHESNLSSEAIEKGPYAYSCRKKYWNSPLQ